MDLHQFNKSLLNCISIIDETGEGHLSRALANGTTMPWTIQGKRVVLPTAANLRNPEANTIVYHPLSENITRGESDVLKGMRDQIMYLLTVRAASIISELGRVAATPSEHKRLDAASQKYLKKLGDFDERSLDFVNNVIRRVGAEPEKRLISISLRKGNQADGVLRRAIFKFPVLDALLSDAPDLLGVKFPSKKSRPAIKALFETVLGDAETRESFNYGSKNLVAPYFDALMNAFFNIATHLNRVVETHGKLLGKEMVEDLTFDLSWYSAMDNLAELRKVVPPQEGNEGAIIVTRAAKEAAKVAEEIAPPRDRAPRAEPERKETPKDLPWDDDEPARKEPVSAARRPDIPRKSLDDVLAERRSGYGRDDRYYDDRRYRDRYYDDRRDDRYRDDRYRRDAYLDRDRGGRRVIDLGLGPSRDDRDRYYDDRRDYRDYRDVGTRRRFGEGIRSVRRY